MVLEPDNNYFLQLGTGDKNTKGEYGIKNDKLILSSYDFEKYSQNISKAERKWIKQNLGEYQILDSLLIPINLNFSVESLYESKQDVNVIEEYISTDSFVFQIFRFYSDSTFEYESGPKTDITINKGQWFRNGNIITISPESPCFLLQMICRNSQLVVIGQFLVLTDYIEKQKTVRYYYYKRLKPAANKR